MINPKIFKAYDIRGIYPTEINEKNIEQIIQAIYTFFVKTLKKNCLKVVLGRDMRLSSPGLTKKACDLLVKLGAQVLDIGLAATPTVYFAVGYLEYDAGIQISASHNPKQYNGIKYLYRNNYNLVKVAKNTGMDEVKNLAISGKLIKPIKGGSIKKMSVLDEEINFAHDTVKPKAIKPFKVVVDPANAMGILFLKGLAKKHPQLKLIKMNFDLDGTFPNHEANPLKFELLKPLQKKVISEKADFGIATDGDADRIFFIDESGQIIPATMITSLIAKEILEKKGGEKILVDVRYVQNAKKIIEENGGKVEVCVVGHSLITEHLNKVNGAFAGESSGHYFFRETGGAESTIRVIYYILDILSRKNKPFSQIVSAVHSFFESGEYNFFLKNSNSQAVLKFLANDYINGDISWLDGLTVDLGDWRFNIRSSNTERLIRLNLEANSKNLMVEKKEEITAKILGLGAEAK